MENKKNSILGSMVAQHALLEALYFVFKDEATKKGKNLKSSLLSLEWETKKHFFIEENAIFGFYPWKKPEIMDTIIHLEKEHHIMLKELMDMTESLPEIKEADLEKFYGLLADHRRTEEQVLYPKLDQELTDVQKEFIVSKINEIPVKKTK